MHNLKFPETAVSDGEQYRYILSRSSLNAFSIEIGELINSL